MTLEELRTECVRLWNVERFEDIFILNEIYKNCLFKIMTEHAPAVGEKGSLKEAKIIGQMMFTKLAHLEQVCAGVTFSTGPGGKTLNHIIDATVVGSMVRGVFESVSVFNMVYVNPETEDQRLILYCLWVISGLNYRQRFLGQVILPENIKKGAEEKILIDKYIKAIEETALYQSLKETDQKKLHNQIDQKKYSVYFDKNKLTVINGFQEAITRAGIRPKIMDNMYNYFSLNAHPSNVAVFQFAQMFDSQSPEFLKVTTFNMKNVYMLLSVFIADYLKMFPGVLSTFEKLPIRDQIVINFLNIFSRTDAYTINNCLLALDDH